MTVTTDSSAIITLVWDGTAWRNYVTSLTFDDAVRPVYLYRGAWNPSFTYRCTGGAADVVYFMGKYYQVKFSVGSTTASPASSNDWEELSRFCAIADEVKIEAQRIGFARWAANYSGVERAFFVGVVQW